MSSNSVLYNYRNCFLIKFVTLLRKCAVVYCKRKCLMIKTFSNYIPNENVYNKWVQVWLQYFFGYCKGIFYDPMHRRISFYQNH